MKRWQKLEKMSEDERKKFLTEETEERVLKLCLKELKKFIHTEQISLLLISIQTALEHKKTVDEISHGIYMTYEEKFGEETDKEIRKC